MSADLIARLEAATEGNAKLDYDIFRAVNEYARTWLEDFPPAGLPNYTTSVEVARTLAPAGRGFLMLVADDGTAQVTFGHLDDTFTDKTATVSATPALALAGAALKARA
jgi:hypothetical protein